MQLYRHTLCQQAARLRAAVLARRLRRPEADSWEILGGDRKRVTLCLNLYREALPLEADGREIICTESGDVRSGHIVQGSI